MDKAGGRAVGRERILEKRKKLRILQKPERMRFLAMCFNTAPV